jgi:hypothetical protein
MSARRDEKKDAYTLIKTDNKLNLILIKTELENRETSPGGPFEQHQIESSRSEAAD